MKLDPVQDPKRPQVRWFCQVERTPDLGRGVQPALGTPVVLRSRRRGPEESSGAAASVHPSLH